MFDWNQFDVASLRVENPRHTRVALLVPARGQHNADGRPRAARSRDDLPSDLAPGLFSEYLKSKIRSIVAPL